MIYSIGTDIVDARRIERLLKRFGQRFTERIFTEQELAYSQKIKNQARLIESYSRGFAAKEAAFKALGTGMRQGISFHDFSVVRDELGKPALHCTGGAQKRLDAIHGKGKWRLHLSLSDEPPYALAFVVLELI